MAPRALGRFHIMPNPFAWDLPVSGPFQTHPRPTLTQEEADVAPKNFPDRVDRIDGALGELSRFHGSFGFYVHGVSIESATIPAGWQERAVRVSGKGGMPSTGLCLESHDLAASKLVAFRAKDREFVRILIVENLVTVSTLLERIQELEIDEGLRLRIVAWVRATARGVSG